MRNQMQGFLQDVINDEAVQDMKISQLKAVLIAIQNNFNEVVLHEQESDEDLKKYIM